MYYEHWGLQKPPFDNVPDPSMYVDCHTSMESAIAETLFGIEEGNECVAVIVGDVGLGKTLSLRMIIDSLDPDKYKIALITNPAMSFIQLLREIIGQLTGKHWTEKKKLDLLETFNKILFETQDEGKRVLIFIDEANAIAPANLESLRLLTNMQQDQGNLFTMILAGQIELARRLEHPKRENFFQRIGTYSRIDKIETPEFLRIYVESRLRLAGGVRKIFTDGAISALWEHSDHGVPRLINKISKLSLKAGETNNLSEITGDVVNQIGERFKKLTRPATAKRRPRKKMEAAMVQERVPETVVDEEVISEGFVGGVSPTPYEEALPEAVTEQEMPSVETDDEVIGHDPERQQEVVSLATAETEEVTAEPIREEAQAEAASEELAEPEIPALETTDEIIGLDSELQEIIPATIAETEESIAEPVHEEGLQETEPAPSDVAPTEELTEMSEKEPVSAEKSPDEEILEEITIGQHRVEIPIPARLIGQARTAAKEQRVKMAGALAAQILQKNPRLVSSHLDDPVHVWGDLRKFILNKLMDQSK